MSFKIGHNLDLTFHQLLNARLQNLAGEPTGLGAGDKGRFFFDTTSGQDCLKVWNGAAFTRLRDDWISGVSPAAGSPLTVAGTQALSLDIALATGSFLVGDGNSKARALAKSAIAISGFGAAAAAVDLGSQRITNLADPVNPGDAANKAYVDATEQGLQPKVACRVATTAALPAHQFGANIMLADANGAIPAIDGVTLQVGDRVLVKNEGSGTHLENGIYTVTALGDASNKWSFTRAGDADTSGEVTTGMYVLISEGTTWKGSGWFLQTAAPITLNTTALTFVQFSSAGSFTAGRGLASVGTSIYFAQTSAYTANTIPYATGESTIGFIGINSTATRKFLRQVSSEAPAWDVLAVGDLPAHTHAIADVTGLQTALDGKAASSHTHAIANVTGLQTALDAKVAGSGTAGKIARFSAAQTLADSSISDDGTNVTLTALQASQVTLGGRWATKVLTLAGSANSGSGKRYIRLRTAASASLGAIRVVVTGNLSYTNTLGFLEADYQFYAPGDGTLNSTYADFRITRTSGGIISWARLGAMEVENGYFSIPVWCNDMRNELQVLLEWRTKDSWYPSPEISPTLTDWAAEAMPVINRQSIKGGLNVTDGNVGIGATNFTPAAALHIYGTTSQEARLLIQNDNAGYGSGVWLKRASNVRGAYCFSTVGDTIDWAWGASLYYGGSASPNWGVSTTTSIADAKLTITPAGRVGIGTGPSNPNSLLELYSGGSGDDVKITLNAWKTGDTAGQFSQVISGRVASGQSFLAFATTNAGACTERARFSHDGVLTLAVVNNATDTDFLTRDANGVIHKRSTFPTHPHAISDVTGLSDALLLKSDVVHTHVPGDITGPGQLDADLIPNLDASKITGGSLGASVTIGTKTICRKVQIAIPVGTTTLALTHNLGTSDLVVMIRPTTGPYWLTDFEPTSANQVTVSFGTATSEAMTAVILG